MSDPLHEDAELPAVREADLEFERYNKTQDVRQFDCGDKGLNEFIRDPAEVAFYQDEGYGVTTVVYHHGELVAYFTLNVDKLQSHYVDRRKLANRTRHRSKEVTLDYPSVKIGRFAVDRRHQRRGIGCLLIRHIAGLALSVYGDFGVRLLILEAYPDAQQFYRRIGFEYTEEVKRERNKRNRTMFFDLWAIRDIA